MEALRGLAAGLPADFPGSVFVVRHTAPRSPGVLAQILDRSGPLHAASSTDRERIRPGRIYVASGDGTAERFLEKAREAERRGELVRRAVFDHENLGEEKVAEAADAPAANV